MRTLNVPVTGAARGESSRTRPLAVTLASVLSATVISGLDGARSLICAGTSNTVSRPSLRAACTTMRPAGTTSPGSVPTAATVPRAWATRRV
jgi:hypothetical protein